MTTDKSRVILVAGTLFLAALFMGAVTGGSARADAFGEIGQVGKFGTGLEEFKLPSDLAVDPTDNSVYVVDAPKGFARAGTQPEYRIQKFASTLGAPLASVAVSTPVLSEGEQFIAGIAVDSSMERLYVLRGAKSNAVGYENVANEIDVYSTKVETTQGGEKTLPFASGIAGGVLYKFSSPPPGTDTVRSPIGLAVDPTTHDLLVLGSDSAGNTEIARFSSSGALKTVYDDGTAHLIGTAGNEPTGLSVGPDGSIYLIVDYNNQTHQGNEPGVLMLSSDFSKVTVVHQVHGERPELTSGRKGGNAREFGPQVAVNPEGTTVYAAQVTVPEVPGTPGNYQVRGMSTSTGAQQVVYGGGTSTCAIDSAENAIAAGSGGVVYALDEGNVVSKVATSYGYHLIEFGPGGTGCPAPTTAVKVNTDTTSPTVHVQKGEEVKFEASTSELHGEEQTELVWEGEGPESYKTEVSGKPAGLTTTHKFLKPGLYTVTLKMYVSPGTLGSPPAVTRKIEVTAPPPTASFEASSSTPKPGETVMFDGGESLDPAGSLTGGPTHTLKSYTWNFGDGSPEVTTTEPKVSHAFANSGTQSVPDTVTLTVTNEEEVQSNPTTRMLTIQGTPETVVVPVKEVVPSPPPPAKPAPQVIPPAKKPLTNAQKLANALKVCKKDKSKKKRTSCEKAAKKKYAPKKKPTPKKK